ncbi:unnamed protein product [Ilex paraguariensis]|uniref:Uncharacterized protein n=1 Tax=Ilex paraguariensis TaxID=185542 RepID=A0ABC8T509_9AQUA
MRGRWRKRRMRSKRKCRGKRRKRGRRRTRRGGRRRMREEKEKDEKKEQEENRLEKEGKRNRLRKEDWQEEKEREKEEKQEEKLERREVTRKIKTRQFAQRFFELCWVTDFAGFVGLLGCLADGVGLLGCRWFMLVGGLYGVVGLGGFWLSVVWWQADLAVGGLGSGWFDSWFSLGGLWLSFIAGGLSVELVGLFVEAVLVKLCWWRMSVGSGFVTGCLPVETGLVLLVDGRVVSSCCLFGGG